MVWDKIKGSGKSPPRVTTREVIWSWIGGFLGIGLLGLLWEGQLVRGEGFMLVGSLGASAVLLYGAPRSPLAQPRNVIGGHVISALVGVTSYKLFQRQAWLASAVAVSTSIALMHLSRTLHPPGGCHSSHSGRRGREDSQSGLSLCVGACGGRGHSHGPRCHHSEQHPQR